MVNGRKIKFQPPRKVKGELKSYNYKNLNWTIQGNCADILLKALNYLYLNFQTRVDILPHFHDELVLKCKICPTHTQDLCPNILDIKQEIEQLYPFMWPGSNTRVFELGVK